MCVPLPSAWPWRISRSLTVAPLLLPYMKSNKSDFHYAKVLVRSAIRFVPLKIPVQRLARQLDRMRRDLLGTARCPPTRSVFRQRVRQGRSRLFLGGHCLFAPTAMVPVGQARERDKLPRHRAPGKKTGFYCVSRRCGQKPRKDASRSFWGPGSWMVAFLRFGLK